MFNNLINALVIFLFFVLASYVITILFGFYEKTSDKDGLSSRVIKASKLPLRFLAVLLGLYFAAQKVELAWSWKNLNLDIIFYILIVLLVCYAVSRLNKAIFSWHASKGSASKINLTTLIFLRKALSIVFYLIGALIIFKKLGIEISPILAGLGVAGIAVALGLQETLQNVFAAAFFVLDKSFNIGDYVQLEDGTRGCIQDISWRSTKLRTIDGNIVILPNSKFVNQKISSFDYKDSSYSISVKVGIAYGSDLEKVEQAASEAALKVIGNEKIKVRDNAPRIRFNEFGDSALNLSVLIKVDKMVDERRVRSELIKAVYGEFNEAGIEIPLPQRVVYSKKV
jgi:small-conductance mechanosensitive channel